MWATIVFARNPRQHNPIEGFVSFTEDSDRAARKQEKLTRDIKYGLWRAWPGESRRHFVKRARVNGWSIHLVTVYVPSDRTVTPMHLAELMNSDRYDDIR